MIAAAVTCVILIVIAVWRLRVAANLYNKPDYEEYAAWYK